MDEMFYVTVLDIDKQLRNECMLDKSTLVSGTCGAKTE